MPELNQDIRQRHVEKFFAEMRGVKASDYSGPEYAGKIVRAAVTSGILSIEGEVDDMQPSEVIRLAGEVNVYLAEKLSVPKN